MKSLLLIPAIALKGTLAFAQLAQPGPKNSQIEDLKKQVVNMIKNEKTKKSNQQQNYLTLVDYNNPADLENAVQLKLSEVSDLIQLRDHKSFDDVLTFTSLAFKAWNPELRNLDLKTQFKKNIAHFGYVDGFVTPVLALMDLSYSTKMIQFGGLMNVMLNEISPTIAVGLKNQYGIPTEFSNLNFQTLRNQGRNSMWSALTAGIDPNFFQIHNTVTPGTFDIDPTLADSSGMDLFITNTLKSKNSYLGSYLKKIGREDNSEKIMANKEMQNDMTGKGNPKVPPIKSVFDKNTSVENDPTSCQAKCYKEIVNVARSSIQEGALLGVAIGTVAGPKGAAAGGLIGGAIGTGAAIYVGYNECQASIQCGGTGSQKEQTAARENEAKAKEAELRAKEQEVRVKEAEARVKTAEAATKEAEQKVKEAKAKAQEAETKAKLAEEQLKIAKDKKAAEENLAKAKKEKEELDKKLAQAKKEQDEAKEKEKKEKDEAEKEKKSEEEKEKIAAADDDKQMIQGEDKKKKMTQEELKQKKETLNSTPAIPPEDGSIQSYQKNNFDLNTKKMDKEGSAKPAEVNTVYPVNPNTGD